MITCTRGWLKQRARGADIPDVRSAGSWWRRLPGLRLFLSLQLAALLPMLAVGYLLDARFHAQQVQTTLRDARRQAGLLGDLVIGPAFGSTDLADTNPLVDQRVLDPVIAAPNVRSVVLRVKVWDRTGRVVASDAPTLVGKRFDIDEDLADAIHGQGGSSLSQLTASENVDERNLPDAAGGAIEAYVPLRATATGPQIGVLEVYLPYRLLAGDLRATRSAVRRDLALGLGALFLALGAVTTPVLRRLRRQAAAAERASVTDDLTGLLNRAGFAARLDQAFRSGQSCAVVLADLQGTSRVNAALGYQAGDGLLTHLAQVLSTQAPGSTLARTAGDQFGLLFTNPQTLLTLPETLRALRRAAASVVEVQGVPLAPALAFGWALSGGSADTTGELLNRAEGALTAAKVGADGIAGEELRARPADAEELRLLTELRSAIDSGQLLLHYQPQARSADGRIVSVEALVRWQHPRRGLLYPGDFLPLAESTGLVTAITRWVLPTAARQAARWHGDGRPVTVSANISGRDLADGDFVRDAERLVRTAGAEPAWMVLELTETALLSDPDSARARLEALAVAGFGLSIDDFGQGYTSLGQLRDLPVHELKLDRTFVAGAPTNPADQAILLTVAQLGHSLGLRLVAEGVETAQQLSFAQAAGFDLVQGWHLGHPAVAAELFANEHLPPLIPA